MKSRSRIARLPPLSKRDKVVGVVVGIVLGWQIITISLAAGHGYEEGDLSAADYATTSQAAAIAAAQQHLDDGDPAGAKVFALHALTISPVSAVALRELWMAEGNLGNVAQQSALVSQAAALGWRDVPTQVALSLAFLQQRNYDAAAQRMDAGLRIDPHSTKLFDILDKEIADPAFARAIVQRLALTPGWLQYYLGYTGGVAPATLKARASLSTDLLKNSIPLPREGLISLLYALTKAKETALARELWLKYQGSPEKNVYDTHFRNIGMNGMSQFEWAVLPVPGASVSADSSRNSGNALIARTDGTAAGVLMRQRLTLSPGPHTLTYDGTMPSSATKSFGWQIRCVDGRIALGNIRQAPLLPAKFDVPVNCDSQYIEFTVSSSLTTDKNEGHVNWVDVN